VAASTRHISHSGHAHLRCIKCNIVTATRQQRSPPGKIPGHQQPAPPRAPSPSGTIYPRPPNPVLHLMQLGLGLEPGHHPPATPSPGPTAPRAPQRAEAPRPPSASRPAQRSSGVPGPARSVTSTLTVRSPAMTATVTVSPGAPELLCRTLLLKTSLTSKTATSPHGCPGPSISLTKARAARARSARPASVTLSRTATLAITAPALPCPHQPGEVSEPPGGHTRMHARLGAARQAWTTRPRGPSVAVREAADGAHRPS
jgi:hypothetical protein